MVHCDPDLKAKVKENRIGVMLGFYYPYLGTLTTHVLERRPAICFYLTPAGIIAIGVDVRMEVTINI